MRPLIDSGYLYIAQPPLYKAKIGKKEQYLKDDNAFIQFLFEWAQEQTVLTVANKEVDAETLAHTLLQAQEYDSKLTTLSMDFKISSDQCNALIAALHKYPWEKGNDIELLLENLQKFFTGYTVKLEQPEDSTNLHIAETNDEEDATEHRPLYSRISFKMMSKHWDIPVTFFSAAETKKAVHLLAKLTLIQDNNWTLQIIGKDRAISGIGATEFLAAVRAISKPFMNIQRYKGLGEMNPDQLWETAMDKTTRSLLKVTVEDTLEADRWFSTLMGEDVKGRKEYIEDFGRFAKNLDV
jgi:DNA gyrase subunit B